MSTYHKNIIIILLLLLSVSCVRIDRIQDVLSDADSLRSVGKLYPDSSQLDSVVSVLKPVRYFYPDEYAAANYHYGRVLRDRNNQLEAMRCFINATHSNTTDYALLGRVYSNMGNMCFYLQDYEMSYTVFQFAKDRFNQTSDTLAILQAINNMACAAASMADSNKTRSLVNEVIYSTTDPSILYYSYQNMAIVFRSLAQYDSAVYYANKSLFYYPNNSTCELIKAQSYSETHRFDSALVYAQKVLEHTHQAKEKYNALYVLSNNSNNLEIDSILTLTSSREDIHNYEIEPKKIQLSQAVQLLSQDLSVSYKRRYMIWAVVLVSIFLLILIIFLLRRYSIRVNNSSVQMIRQLQAKTEDLQVINSGYRDKLYTNIENVCNEIRTRGIRQYIAWNDYEAMCSVINSFFNRLAEKLRAQYNLNEKEVRLCVLTLIDDKLSGSQMSNLLIYSEKSVRGLRSKTAKKLNTDGKQFRNKLLEIVLKTA